MSQSYKGAQDQNSGVVDFNALDFHVQQQLARINTATIVKIIKSPYDKQGNAIDAGSMVPVGYVDVQPMVNQIDGQNNATPHGKVYHLSYHRYQGGLNAIICDPEVGDIGKMVVSNRDTSSVKATDAVANPGSRRKFDMADGTFFGSPQAKAPNQYLRFTSTGIEIGITKNTTTKIFIDQQGHVTITGDLHVTGAVIAGYGGGDQIGLQTHKHDGVMTGSGDTSAPNPGT